MVGYSIYNRDNGASAVYMSLGMAKGSVHIRRAVAGIIKEFAYYNFTRLFCQIIRYLMRARHERGLVFGGVG
jgi:hypothetical protein